MQRSLSVILCLAAGLFAAGCPKGSSNYSKGRKAESLQDYDAALDFYQKALKSDPNNASYKIRYNQTRFEAGELHIREGLKLRQKGDLEGAAAQFQRASNIDPSSPVASEELRKTLELIADKNKAANPAATPSQEELRQYLSLPPEIKPIPTSPITLKISNDAKIVFDAIGKLAGLTVVYDPDFPQRKISVDLNNVTLEQALAVVSFESKAFWKPLTENIILVAQDQTQKRLDYEEEVLQTFYLSNTVTPQDLTEIVTGLRSLFDLKRIQQVNSQNAIVVRATPDVLAVVKKVIDDVDKAKPEVVVQVEVLEARTDRLRNLGILPPQSFTAAVNPNASTTSNSNGSTPSSSSGPTLNQFKKLNGNDVVFNAPSATLNAVLTDTDTKIIQNPELRSIDGQQAKLKIGDRIPIATGSFQAGVGVGAVGTAGLVNPLVNTQFQYQDVGVNIDITPRVHPNHEVSLKTKIEVSSVTGQSPIGGITQPIISQRVVEHDIRLSEGEVSILAGLIQRTDQKSLNGWPGLAKIPIIRYLFSSDNVEHQEDEVLIVLIPHIVRLPDWTRANLRPLATGTDHTVQVRRESEVRVPTQEPAKPPTPATPATPTPPGVTPGVGPGATAANPPQGQPGKLRFEPAAITLKVGETKTVGVVVENVTDLFSIPMLVQFNPAVVNVGDVQHAVSEGQHGGFLSGGTQEIAIVSNTNNEKGQAIISATRQPNTAGVSGSGTVLGIVIKGVAPGTSTLQIVQQNAKDSQQRPIPLVTGEATIQVQP